MENPKLHPAPQRVPVIPAIENDVVAGARGGRREAIYEPSRTPIRCQIWDHRRLVGVVPVTLNDMGHPSDLVFTPKESEKVTRLAFVYGGKTYATPLDPTGKQICAQPFHPGLSPEESCGKEARISPSKPLHLALGHLKLLSKFGMNALKAGR